MEQTFTPQRVDFNESEYLSKIQEIKNLAEFLNTEHAAILADFPIKLDDGYLKEIYLEDNIKDSIKELFLDLSTPAQRTAARNELFVELTSITRIANQPNDKRLLQYLIVKGGKFILDPKKDAEIKQSFEKYISNDRQLKIHNLQEEIYQKVNELRAEVGSPLFMWQSIFYEDSKGNLQKNKLNYNNL